MSHKKALYIYVIIVILPFVYLNCAYYNTFFNTKKFFNEAEKDRIQAEKNAIKNRSQNSNNNQASDSRNNVSPALKQKYQKAIDKASRIFEFYSDSKYVDDALLITGKSYFHQQEFRKAKRKFEELLNNYPESEFIPEASLWLGKTNTELRDYETAEQNFRDILTDKSKRYIRDEAQFLLGGLHFHKEDYFTALNEYKKTSENAKEKSLRAYAFYKMGECYIFLKDYKQAALSFDNARKFSQDADAEFNAKFSTGLAYKKLADYEQSILIFTELISDLADDPTMEDKLAECKLEIADCRYLKGDIDNAITWYEAMPEEHKNNKEAIARAYFNLGKIYQMNMSEYEKAKEYYDLAVKNAGRSDISDEAKSRQKSVQDLLALRADILEQEKRIARGDSTAAAMDSIEVARDFESLFLIPGFVDTLWSTIADSFRWAFEDTVNDEVSNIEMTKERENFLRKNVLTDSVAIDSILFENRELLKQFESKANLVDTKVSLKGGKLGTPEEELVKDRLMLAEIYLLDFDQPDSALNEYKEIMKRDTTEEIISKALFSIGYIFEKYKRDTLIADSIYMNLMEKYPQSPYSDMARKKLNIPIYNDTDDNVKQAFIHAEKKYIESKDFRGAISNYEKIVDSYPESLYASKSLYAIGWIYEKNLYNNQQALQVYQKLLEKYPETDYAKRVKRKVTEVTSDKKDEQKSAEPTDTVVDSTASVVEEQTDEIAEQEIDISELIKKDPDSYRKKLIQQMEKDNIRLRNPKRIIN